MEKVQVELDFLIILVCVSLCFLYKGHTLYLHHLYLCLPTCIYMCIIPMTVATLKF